MPSVLGHSLVDEWPINMFVYKAIRRSPSPFPQRVKAAAPQDAVTTTTRKKQQADVSRKQGSLDGHSS
jgi:hypothetical protein